MPPDVGALPADGAGPALSSFPDGGIALVFGAGGGIGRAIVTRLRSSRRFADVMGLSRSGDLAVDLGDEASIARAVAAASARGDLRLVVVATGFLHDGTQAPEKSWRELDEARLARSFAVNAIGPALIMKHALPLLPAQGKSLLAVLSARVGSIGDNELGGWYGYRASKAALNQFVRTAAVELRRRRPHAVCVALHPGTVATRLSAPFAKTGLEIQSADVAAGRLLAVIDGLSPHQSGGFFDHHGHPVPW